MRRVRWVVAATVLAATALAGVVAEPAAATDGAEASGATSDVFGEPLAEFLESYPSARSVGGGVYELAPGVRLVPPAAAAAPAQALEWPSNCADNWYCVYQHSNFGGWGLHYYYCSTVNLAPEHRNRVSSMHNAQNSLTAYFWDTSPYVQGALGPNRYLRNLAQDTAPDGRSWNDRIDRIDPC